MTGLGVKADVEFRCDLGYATSVKGACVADLERGLYSQIVPGHGSPVAVSTLSLSETISATVLSEAAERTAMLCKQCPDHLLSIRARHTGCSQGSGSEVLWR